MPGVTLHILFVIWKTDQHRGQKQEGADCRITTCESLPVSVCVTVGQGQTADTGRCFDQ